ncbi:MAG: GerAB/ArcD/ProY family transporter [Candidatus Limivivens sp.]|nr:GerAB/ArcD/ProY family transporter [Candidatus Limivivens sp.]
MFAGNGRISDRQFYHLLVLDWFGKGALLIPSLAGTVTARELILCLILGFLLAFLYVRMLCGISGKMNGDFPGYLRKSLGKWAEWAIALIFLLYAFFNLLFLARAFGEIGVLFVVPESGRELLMVLLLAAGAAAAMGGLEVRARTASVLYPVLFWPMLALILFSAFRMNPEYLQPGTAVLDRQGWSVTGRAFLAFGGAGVFLFPFPKVTGKSARAFQKGTLATCAGLLALMLVIIGSYGEGGLKAMEWPSIRLMSSAELPGVFLQRWDVIFVGMLLMELFLTAGTSLYYLNLCGGRLWGHAGKGQIFLWCALVFAAAYVCGSYERAVKLYTAVNGWTVTAAAALLVLLWLKGKGGRRR